MQVIQPRRNGSRRCQVAVNVARRDCRPRYQVVYLVGCPVRTRPARVAKLANNDVSKRVVLSDETQDLKYSCSSLSSRLSCPSTLTSSRAMATRKPTYAPIAPPARETQKFKMVIAISLTLPPPTS